MSQNIVIPNALGLRRQVDKPFEFFDLTFHLDSRLIAFMDKHGLTARPEKIRTMTLGLDIYTEYESLDEMPVETLCHEVGHSFQWYTCRWPRSPNFLLNYFVLKSRVWEEQATLWAPQVRLYKHPLIYVPASTLSLTKI